MKKTNNTAPTVRIDANGSAGGYETCRLTITSKLLRANVPQEQVWGDDHKNLNLVCNAFRITVKAELFDDLAAGNGHPQEYTKANFKYYGSHNDAVEGVTELHRAALLDAFTCIINDASCGNYSFEEFCREVGYDEDSRYAEHIHKKCEETAAKIAALYYGKPTVPDNFESAISAIEEALEELPTVND